MKSDSEKLLHVLSLAIFLTLVFSIVNTNHMATAISFLLALSFIIELIMYHGVFTPKVKLAALTTMKIIKQYPDEFYTIGDDGSFASNDGTTTFNASIGMLYVKDRRCHLSIFRRLQLIKTVRSNVTRRKAMDVA